MTCGVHLTCGEVLLQLMVIGLSNGAIIALNAIGVTLVYGAVRTINFAYGDLFALTTVVITTIVTSLGLRLGMSSGLLIGGLGLALAAALIFGVLVNIGVERIAFRPFQSSARLAPLIATIGISFILYQAALIWRTLEPSFRQARHFSDANNVQDFPISRIPELLPQIDLTRAAGITLDVPFTLKDLLVIGLAALIAVLVTWFLGRTRAGEPLHVAAQGPAGNQEQDRGKAEQDEQAGGDVYRSRWTHGSPRPIARGKPCVGRCARIWSCWSCCPRGDKHCRRWPFRWAGCSHCASGGGVAAARRARAHAGGLAPSG